MSGTKRAHNVVPQSTPSGLEKPHHGLQSKETTTLKDSGSKRRLTKTCEVCRRSKPKDDVNSSGICYTCNKAHSAATMAEYRRRRNEKNLRMINRLEANIERMEDRLQELGFDLANDIPGIQQMRNESQQPLDLSAGENYSTEDACIEPAHPNHPTAADRDATPVSGAQCNSFENIVPDTLSGFYVPRGIVQTSSLIGLDIISEEGRAWINQHLSGGCASTLSSFSQCEGEKQSARFPDDVFSSAVFCPMPPKCEALHLLEDYLHGFHLLCPLFQRSKLLSLFHDSELQYNSQTPSRWACINVVLALGNMRPAKPDGSMQHDHKQTWMYMKNALGTVNKLFLGPPDIWAIQGLLGMAIFLLGKASPRLCEFLVSTAVNMSQQMGLDRSETGHDLCDEEREDRRRVFWMAYCLDREVSLRFGKPLSQDDENMDVGLPVDVTADGMSIDQQQDPGFDTFRAICQLAVIRGRLYKQLYSARATQSSLNEVTAAVGMLDEELQRWNESIPLKHRPGSLVFSPGPPSPMSPWVLYLHYSYYNCIIAIHSVTANQTSKLVGTRGKDFTDLSGVSSNSRIFLSATLCAKAARASINLMRYTPEENVLLVEFLIHYPIVASIALSCSIIRNPTEIYRTYDERIIAKVENFLSSVALSIPPEIINHLMELCQKCRLIAEAALDRRA